MTLVDAITSIEDHRFFNHRGVDPTRIIGSVLHNAQNSSTQGGSTLTQQLIKLSYFSTNKSDQTIKRKAQEAWLSVQLERKESKPEIMTLYINKVYMGNGYYGMRTAAKNYYGKELKDLSIPQIALLAGLPQSPNGYDPYSQPEQAKARRDMVLGAMLNYQKISKEDYQKAIDTPIDSGLRPLQDSITFPAYLDNFLKQVIAEVKEKSGQDIATAGLKVYTTIDDEAQKRLYDIINTNDYVNFPDADLQVATTIVDVNTGAVIAQVGGRNIPADTKLGTNQAVSTDRDWGSTMKPLVDYAPAYDFGVYNSTGKMIDDSYYYYPGTDTPVYDWDRQYMGMMTIRTAIRLSRNVPAVKTLDAVGLDNSQAFLKKVNINFPELHYSNAISSNTSEAGNKWGASSEKMAAAYAAFGNGGTYTKPYYVTKVIADDGQEKVYKPETSRAMKETTAFLMTNMLKDVITNGTMTNANIPGLVQAGKTGTSNYADNEYDQAVANAEGVVTQNDSISPDENFVGFTPHYSMAVWTGYKNRMIPIYGDRMYIATDVYREMMTYLASTVDNNDWVAPEGVVKEGSEYTVNQ